MTIQVPTRLLDGAVLAFLAQNDLYGYALTKQVQTVFDISESTIYPVLRRLKQKDYLSVYDKPYQGRNRRYYRITDAGVELLNNIENEWQEFSRRVGRVLGVENEENN